MPHAPEEEIGYLLKRLMHVFRHVLELRLKRSADMSFAHLVTLDQILAARSGGCEEQAKTALEAYTAQASDEPKPAN